MCRRHTIRTHTAAHRHSYERPRTLEYDGAYEGETVHLVGQRSDAAVHPARGRCGSFPWWTLWLIWPLIGLIKGVAFVLPGVLVALSGLVRDMATVGMSLLAIGLIIVGAWLIRGSASDEPSDDERV